MNRKKCIICLATHPWQGLPHRSRHLMSRMKEVEILYFYPAPTQSRQGQSTASKKQHRVRPGVYVYPLPQDLSPQGLFSRLRQKRLAGYIAHIASKHRASRPLLWVTSPQYHPMLPHLNYHYLVYDCAKLWQESLFAHQEALVQASDLIFAASESLKAGLSQFHKNVALLENGVNNTLYAASTPLPPQNQNYFGFVGQITPDLDLSPLVYGAQQEPFWHFFLLGPCHQGNPALDRLSRLPNVHLLGEKSPLEVPEFLMNCHVLLDFSTNRPAHDITPLHLYEYFATGRPIVSCLKKDEIERFPDVIYSAYHQKDFLDQCQLALCEDPDFVFARRRNYAANASWSKRVDAVLHIFHSGGIL